MPGHFQSLGGWIALLLPDLDRRARRALVADGKVRVDGAVADRATADVPEGAEIVVALSSDDGDDAFEDAGGAEGSVGVASSAEWTALIDAPPWRAASIRGRAGVGLNLVVDEVREDIARVRLHGDACSAADVCDALAAIDRPVIGDLRRGGLGWPGGARLAASGDGVAALDLADLPFPAWRWDHACEVKGRVATHLEDAGVFLVSKETSRAIRSGHPWILADAASDPASRFRPGALVEVRERAGQSLGWAHIEGTRRVAARMWHVGAAARREVASIESRVARAIARRAPLLLRASNLDEGQTDAFRLIHGEGDDLPGLYVDCLGSLLRVLVSSEAAVLLRDRVVRAIRQQLPLNALGMPWSVLELLHLKDASRGIADRVNWQAGGLSLLAENGHECVEGGFIVHERGLRFEVDPGWADRRVTRPGYGLFVDQRENRDRVAVHAAKGGKWLNLFAHTGAFSVALLAAGAEEVVSVDLSPVYLDRLERNLELNRDRGVDPSRHQTVRGEARRALDPVAHADRYRGIVIDPPTAAAAGRHFWSVKDDLEPLLRMALQCLEPGGMLLVTQNRAGPPLGLDRVLRRLAKEVDRALRMIEPAMAGGDHPRKRGFPEGDPFEGWVLILG